MTRYFFNVKYSDRVLIDPEGSEMVSLAEARTEAHEILRDLVAASITSRATSTPLGVEALDEYGASVAAVSLEDVLPATLRRA